ncbi:hypothetical protein DEU34_1147 [Microbacterium sp. AG1240]|uniref:hypothetical protein n=1 Tax=Microbacterium sp. AG1240 TaxID=2183992 RepID=UPI000EAFA4FD|nr:hypothetical protein [Microbacterium sp. AG1240]RKT36629.1 hypothetical protein DEU34_1147 [Microbacterium sp. AG1240]
MSREEHAREGAQAVIPDDEVLDVAVVMPRGSTFAGVLGAAAGVAGGGSNATAWGVAGGMIGERVNAASKGSYPSLVLALSAKRLYVLGRTSTGLVGGWKHLHPVAHIDRDHLEVTKHRRGTVLVIGLTDTTTGTTLEVEAQNIGGLGLKDLLGEVEADGSTSVDADGEKS